MPNSLKTKLSKLRYQGKITDEEYKELIDKLEGHDEAITAQIMWERDIAIEQLKLLGYGLGEKVEPCEDCVSRDAVEKITWEEPSYDDALNVLTEVRDKVRALPSVTPQRPKGRWIEQTDKNKKLYGWFYCSECGAVLGQVDGANYCSECGAEMEGSNGE